MQTSFISHTPHMATGLVALSSSGAVSAWPCRFQPLAYWPELPCKGKLAFRQLCRVSSARFGMVCMCPKEQLPPKGPSFAFILHGFCALVRIGLCRTLRLQCHVQPAAADCMGSHVCQWNRAGLLGQQSPGIWAALCDTVPAHY